MADAADDCVDKFQSIVFIRRRGLIREPCFVHRFVKPVAAAIAGKHATGSIGSVCSGSQSHNEKIRLAIAKIFDWLSPVLFADVSLAFLFRDRFTVLDQTRTFFAANDSSLKALPVVGFGCGFTLRHFSRLFDLACTCF